MPQVGKRVEHDHPIRDSADGGHIVCHHDAGHLTPLLCLHNQMINDTTHDGVEPCRRFVVKNNVG